MLAALRATEGEAVGDNEPYAMDTIDFTIPHHADPRGLDYLELEVRQDLLANRDGTKRIAAILAPLLTDATRRSFEVEATADKAVTALN